MESIVNPQFYLEHIGYDGPLAVNVATLSALNKAQTCSITFGNVDVLLGHPAQLEIAAIYDKLLLRHRGGYCFEQNGLLMYMLRQFGFEVRPLRAAVRLAQSDRRIPVAHTHLALEVTLGKTRWLADAGIGATSLTAALRLEEDVIQSTPHDKRRLVRENGRWYHQVLQNDQWMDIYEFSGETMSAPDRKVANWYTSTHTDTSFAQYLQAALAKEDGRRMSLRNRNFTLREADGTAQRKRLSDPELIRCLREDFRLKLDDDSAAVLLKRVAELEQAPPV